ncbi:hypothetical protein V8G54_034040 [Vigna mungo]|uniref:Retrotransposon gag domain-containing protein n=1 Tax=Vigna mungo TaxID=3915 RepID=A0AAQ3MPH2_VIGMU
MEGRMSMLERTMEETREESEDNFQRLSEMMEDVMRKLKNIEKGKGSVNGEDSVYGDKGELKKGILSNGFIGLKNSLKYKKLHPEKKLAFISMEKREKKLASISMERRGKKLAFIGMERRRKKTNNSKWEDLTEALVRRFGEKDRAKVFEKLVAVRQKGEVEDYIQGFEKAMEIARDVEGVSRDVKAGGRTTFRNNLYLGSGE